MFKFLRNVSISPEVVVGGRPINHVPFVTPVSRVMGV